VHLKVLTSALADYSGRDTQSELMPVMTSWGSKALQPLLSQIGHFQPDIIHIQFPTQGYDSVKGLAVLAYMARWRLGIPVVATMHEYLPTTFHQSDLYIHAIACFANRIIAVRPDFHARLHWLLKPLLRESKIKFIASASSVPRVILSSSERKAIKQELGCASANLVAFFGFSFPHKGVDLLFQIADPRRHHLLLIGELSSADAYHKRILELAQSGQWAGRTTITGFVDADKAARLLAAADAVVFPYRLGGGVWNSSLHAALSQDTFVLTTSNQRRGYDRVDNVYYASPDAVDEMRQALLSYENVRISRKSEGKDPWRAVALAHYQVYASLLDHQRGRA
jgi:glycosyltransferase involved in cell wall biosynthesis